ncbi:MAG: hypothetical protein ACXVBV_19255, partial [Isosphaeraceae bacterium]
APRPPWSPADGRVRVILVIFPVRPIPRRVPRRGDRPRPRNRHALAARSDWLRHVRGPPSLRSTFCVIGAIAPYA